MSRAMMLAMEQVHTTEEVVTYADEELLLLSITKPHFFAELVRRYEEPFLRKARTVLKNNEDAEDVVQETFTKVYLNAPRFQKQEGASFKSWGYTILMNTAFTAYSKKRRRFDSTQELDPEWYEALPDPEHQFEKQEVSDYMISLFARMPEHFVRALKKQFFEGKTHEEIAREEGVSVGAIKTRVHRAKQALEDVVKDEEEQERVALGSKDHPPRHIIDKL